MRVERQSAGDWRPSRRSWALFCSARAFGCGLGHQSPVPYCLPLHEHYGINATKYVQMGCLAMPYEDSNLILFASNLRPFVLERFLHGRDDISG